MSILQSPHDIPLTKTRLEKVAFSLKELLKSIDNLANIAPNPKNIKSALDKKSLLPRRQELINIIQDHPYISLDSLSRRFPTIPRRTIAYDVNYLAKNSFIIKHGKTRGVRYSLNSY